MAILNVTPMLRTKNLRESVAFYTNVLGFACNTLNEEWGWALVTRDNANIMLATPNEHEPFEQPAFTGSLYFHTTDVAPLWEKLKHAANLCYPLEDFEYGMREFAIYDNNGYVLQFGQDISGNR